MYSSCIIISLFHLFHEGRTAGFCALCAIQKHVSRALQLPGRSLAPKDLVSNLRCILLLIMVDHFLEVGLMNF